jgi:UDP-2-acetamido-2,6-beta-L-arabino-hexul-4-ose reductase
MNIKKIGITGQSGFIGTHLYNVLGLFPEKFERIPFESYYFNDATLLAHFVKRCDVIVHLAAINRHFDMKTLYDTNIALVKTLIQTMENENVKPHIIFASSTQESLDNPYGKSKHDGRSLLEAWAMRSGSLFTCLIVPNVFGPFGRPNYNSFVATFCCKLVHNEIPEIITDGDINLVYVYSLCKYIILEVINNVNNCSSIRALEVPHDFSAKVSQILSLLQAYKHQYFEQGIIPCLADANEVNLFNTFRSYIDFNLFYPRILKQNIDERGVFAETIKHGTIGQASFSITKPGITRGNHYHTRKIERFTVLKGKAKIQIRKVGTEYVYEFCLDGQTPSYVDMPVWYTHNITNIGSDDLYTQFWINEWYDPSDADTFFEYVDKRQS